MIGHVLHAAFWLAVIGALHLHYRPDQRREVFAAAVRMWRLIRRTFHSLARTAVAVWRVVTFHPYRPGHRLATPTSREMP